VEQLSICCYANTYNHDNSPRDMYSLNNGSALHDVHMILCAHYKEIRRFMSCEDDDLPKEWNRKYIERMT